MLRQLKDRATFLFAAIEQTIGSLQGASYHPLGACPSFIADLLCSVLVCTAGLLTGLKLTAGQVVKLGQHVVSYMYHNIH